MAGNGDNRFFCNLYMNVLQYTKKTEHGKDKSVHRKAQWKNE